MLKSVSFQKDGVPYGMAFDLDPEEPSQKTVLDFFNGGNFYEPDISNVLLRVLKPGDLFVDVGANIGIFSVLARLLVGDTGNAVAFEPAEKNLLQLRRNLELNGMTDVATVPKIVSNRPGTADLFLCSDNGGGHSIWPPGNFPPNERSRQSSEAVPTDVTTLDIALAELMPGRAPKLIKIDTEGAEQMVLEGAERLLSSGNTPFIIGELHEFGLSQLGHSQDSLRRHMQVRGYETFILFRNGALPKYLPPATRLRSKYFQNILFAKPEAVGAYWPLEIVE
jgi:FkbM family methyltransferase